MKQGLWLSRDEKGYCLWAGKPAFCGVLFQESYDASSELLGDLVYKYPNIEDIFIKLSGTEMKIGKCIRVNLVEDDLKETG